MTHIYSTTSHFDSTVWGPHFWFFLHTLAFTYPELPNDVIKRKYYDLIMNFPLFLPDCKMGADFAHMLEKYPCVPYLDTRDSFIRWVNFIHNKINRSLNKPEVPLMESLDDYILYYQRTSGKKPYTEKIFYMDIVVYCISIFLLLLLISYLTMLHTS